MPTSAGATPDGSVAQTEVQAVAPRTGALGYSGAEWLHLAGFYGVIALLHLLGWGLVLQHAARHPALTGLGLAAYLFGLRHAFDADHIAAVDDSVRYLLQKGRRPLGIGFFFSLGHASVVFGLALAIAVSAAAVKRELPALQSLGGVIGGTVSGLFLWFIGVLNLLVLLDILKVWRQAGRGPHAHTHVDQLLARRGLMNRLFGGRLQRLVEHSWQMFPLGLLFGLGFDTASEIGLLAMTAGASSGALPLPAIVALPLLFAAGMAVIDTTDGVLMSKAYGWALLNPRRRIFYSITTTGLSVAVALLIGSIELLQVLGSALHLGGRLFDLVGALDLGLIGGVIVALFLMAWAVSFALWRFGDVERRHGSAHRAHAHEHAHEGGVMHTHEHLH